MKAITKILLTAVLPMLLLASTGCSTTGCTDERSALPLAGFYSYETRKAISLNSVEIGGVGAPGDSLLLKGGTMASEVYLPLRSQQTSTKFFIRYLFDDPNIPEIADTITLGYTAIPYFASEECGAMMSYRIHTVSHTRLLLDSVAVIAPDSLITNVAGQNMRLFFHTEQ